MSESINSINNSTDVKITRKSVTEISTGITGNFTGYPEIGDDDASEIVSPIARRINTTKNNTNINTTTTTATTGGGGTTAITTLNNMSPQEFQKLKNQQNIVDSVEKLKNNNKKIDSSSGSGGGSGSGSSGSGDIILPNNSDDISSVLNALKANASKISEKLSVQVSVVWCGVM